MSQSDLDRAVARATGETVTEIELTVRMESLDESASVEVPAIASAAPIHGTSGIVGVILTVRTVPRIRDRERCWEDFVSTVVHESRGALSAILGCVSLVESLAQEPIRPRRTPGYVDPETQFLGMIKSDAWQISAMLTELLDVARIGAHDGRSGVESRLEHHVVANETLQEALHAADDPVQIDRVRRGTILTTEEEKLAGERGSALAGLGDLVDEAPQRIVRGQASQRQLTAARHGHQHVVEVVSDAAGQEAESLHLLSLAQLLLQPAALGNVERNAAKKRPSLDVMEGKLAAPPLVGRAVGSD